MSAIAATAATAIVTADDIDMTIPTASEVEQEESQEEYQEESQEVLVGLSLEQVQEFLPHLEVPALLDILTTVNGLLKKKWKEPKTKKTTTAPRKVSAALVRNQGWLAYLQKYAMNNGWEAFKSYQKTKDKTTGEELLEETDHAESKANDSSPPYTFKDAKTGEIITPAYIFSDTGKHLTYKHAMSLSTQWKWAAGVAPTMKFSSIDEEQAHWSELYCIFWKTFSQRQPTEEETSSSTASTPSAPTVVRLTAAEREAEREEKRRIAEEEKESKRKAREEKKEQTRQKREKEEAEKAQRRQEREEKKAQKEKEAEEKRTKKASVGTAAAVKTSVPAAKAAAKAVIPAKAAAVPAASKATAAPKATAPAPAPAPAAKKVVAAKAAPKQLEKPKMTLDVPKDGMVHKWTWEGKTYLVNSDGCVWNIDANGDANGWVGLIDLAKQIIDTSVEEPEYDEE